jgi:Circadian oscillating protein COP23
MKKQLAILVTGLLAAQTIMVAPALAQEQDEIEGRFYCGKSYNPASRQSIPTMLLSSSNREKPLAVIMWESKYFSKEYTPQKRCSLVSSKFQAAYMAGKLEYLIIGKDKKTKAQIVCGVRIESESCNKNTNMLFTLEPYADSRSVLGQLIGSLNGEATTGLTQGSESNQIFKLGDFLRARK